MLHGTRRALWGRRAAAPAPTTVPCLPGQVGRGGWIYGTPPNAPFVMNTHSPQARGLMGWWPMLGQRGNTATLRDRVFNRFQMTQGNTPTWSHSGEVGPTLAFNAAASEYAVVDAAPVTTYPYTLACWFRPHDVTNSYVVMDLCDSTAINSRIWMVSSGGALGDPLQHFASDGLVPGGTSAGTTNSITATRWHLGVCVGISATSRIVVLDGNWPARGTDANNITPAGINRADLARAGDATPSLYFDGEIADARIYNRALSAAEVWALWNPATRWELYRPVGRWR